MEIPGSVESIEGWAFQDCASLASVTIPGSVKSIGNSAFYGCDSLTEVKYGGTKEQWNAIVGIAESGIKDKTIVFEGEAN